MPAGDSLIHSTAGALGGMLSMAMTYPLISLSTRAQVENGERKSLVKRIQQTIERDGVLSFFDGLDSSLVAIGATNAIYYYFYEESRSLIVLWKAKRSGGKTSAALSTAESMLASFAAGTITSTFVNPIWVVNTRQTTSRSLASTPTEEGKLHLSNKPEGFFKTLVRLLKQEGISSLFAGLGPALILVVNPILQYTAFEQLKNLLIMRRLARLPKHMTARSLTDVPPSLPLSDFDYFWLGAVSKLFATGVTFPYLNIKTRMQAHKGDGSYTDGLLSVIRKEGLAALYKGIAPKLTQSVLAAAILFMTQQKLYHLIKRLLTARQTLRASA